MLLFATLVGWRLRRAGRAPASGTSQDVARVSLSAGSGRATGPALAGVLLPAPRWALRSPHGGHIERLYAGPQQRVRLNELLVKLTVGPTTGTWHEFALAPAAGEIMSLQVQDGRYLARGQVYGQLALRRPARVRVAAAAATLLCPGDTLLVLAGPPELRGQATPLTAVLPAAVAGTVILVLRRTWAHSDSAGLRVAPLLSRPVLATGRSGRSRPGLVVGAR